MDEVARGLFVGSFLEASHERLLEKYSIGAIVNCCNQPPDQRLYERLGIKVRWEPFDDEVALSLDAWERILQSFQFVKEELEDDTSVLVHCRAGVSRSPAFAAAYLYWSRTEPTFERALRRVCAMHSAALPHYHTLSSFRAFLGLPDDPEYRNFWEKEAVARGYRPAP